MAIGRRLAAGLLALGLLICGDGARADLRVLRIGSGGLGGTYYPIASLIGRAMSGVDCDAGADCGVPDLAVIAQASNGSVANLEALAAGRVELAMAQANVVHAAIHGTGPFAGGAHTELRAIGALYVEALHLAVRPAAAIRTVRDLRGRTMSLDEPGSGTLVDAQAVLRAYGLSEADLSAEYTKPEPALAAMADGRMDGLFTMAGSPVVSLLAAFPDLPIAFVPVDGPEAEALAASTPYYVRTEIPAGAYPGTPATPTIGTPAILLVSAGLDEDTAYAVTAALWSERTARFLAAGHVRGADLRQEHALRGVPVALHPGAARYYRAAGLLP